MITNQPFLPYPDHTVKDAYIPNKYSPPNFLTHVKPPRTPSLSISDLVAGYPITTVRSTLTYTLPFTLGLGVCNSEGVSVWWFCLFAVFYQGLAIHIASRCTKNALDPASATRSIGCDPTQAQVISTQRYPKPTILSRWKEEKVLGTFHPRIGSRCKL